MSIIYKPKGKAREYSSLAVNLYTGCQFGCIYCYCPSIRRQSLSQWSKSPEPRKNVLVNLEKEAAKMRGDPRPILLSFMSDPYQDERAADITRQALQIFARNDLTVQILTKNTALVENDFDIISENGWWLATTAIFLDESLKEKWEPGAPSIESRLKWLHKAYQHGIKTWVSIEPVIDTAEALAVIDAVAPYAVNIKIGRWNYNREANKIDWAEFLYRVLEKVSSLRQSYYIKNDLWCYADEKTKVCFSQRWGIKS